MIQKIKNLAKEIFPNMVAVRRLLHRYPELSFCEFMTAAFIDETLSRWDIEHVTGFAKTGVVAEIKGKNPEKYCIALRADMDALPIEEKNNCDYRSENQGVMHACGHDAHVAMLLGAAKILNALKDDFEGSVKLIFQPAEEKLPGGAKAMIDEGVLDGVDAIVAQHVYPDLPSGVVGFHSGTYMASSDEVNIMLRGRGGHAAKPSERDNIIVAASRLLLMLSELSDEFKHTDNQEDKTILAFGSLLADGTYNVMPDIVTMKGTLRTFNECHRTVIKQKINEISQNIAADFGISAEVFIQQGYPCLINDIHLTNTLKTIAEELLGIDNVVELPQLMTSEDFATFSHHIPACFFRLGTSNINKGIIAKQHTANFDIDEDAMESGIGLMAWLAVKTLNSL